MRRIILLLTALILTGGTAQAETRIYFDVSDSIRFDLYGKYVDVKTNDSQTRAYKMRSIVAAAISQMEVGGVMVTPWHEKLALPFYVRATQANEVETVLRQRIYSYGLPTKLGASLASTVDTAACQSYVVITDDFTYEEDKKLLERVLGQLLSKTGVTILMLQHPGAESKMQLYRDLNGSTNYTVAYLTVPNMIRAMKGPSGECPIS